MPIVDPVQLQIVCEQLWRGLTPEVTEITADYITRYADVNQALVMFYERAIKNVVKAS